MSLLRKISSGAFLILLILFAILHPNPIFATPPTNFSTSLIISSGLSSPTGFAFAPDGRIFIMQRTGEVKIYKNGALLSANFVSLPAATNGDRGLIGIAFDPNWNTNHFVYFYYSDSTDNHNYLVRYNSAGDVASSGPVIIYQTPDQSLQTHVGGGLDIGPDGKIYISIGDNGTASNAQSLGNIHGKILRINPDGTVPSDNPYVGQVDKDPYIWAYGLRNPYRMQFDSGSGRLYIGDVGQETWEEIDIGTKGGNFGWPNCEGTCSSPNPSFADPIFQYNHNGASMAVTGGPIYRGSMFPAGYQGRYFFGDYAAGFIKTLTLDSNGQSTGVSDFEPSAGSVVDLKTAPDGALYYITIFPGRLYRVSYSTTNPAPVANSSADKTTGQAPLAVNFSSSGSFDPNGDPITFSWNFGDGSNSNSPNPAKTYNTKGTYIVQLAVSDGTNNAQAVPITIQVGTPPTLTISAPANNSSYQAGDTIAYAASAVDGQGQNLGDNGFSTTVLFHHGTHIHPFLGPVAGRNGSFTIPTTGEASSNTWFEVQITATDSNGLSTTKSVNINPVKTNLVFTTNPQGLQLYLNSIPAATPQNITSVVNFQWSLQAVQSQSSGGFAYQFDHWSDSGGATHTISAPTNDTTYTAFYNQTGADPNFSGTYYSNQNLTGSPTLTRSDPAVNFDWGTGSPDPNIPVDHFSVRWTKSTPFTAGVYRFTVTADDGVRLKIDGTTAIDKWIDQGPTTYTTDQTLTAGNHTIVMECYENGGGAVAKLSWTLVGGPPPPPPPPSSGFTGEYYSNQTLTGTPALTRTDSAINFDWVRNAPDPSLPVDHFSVRWTGNPTFTAGTYRFTATADDGLRVKVDGTTIIDQWKDQPATTYTVDIALTSGPHSIVMEYYENMWDAVAKLSWALVSSPPPPPPASGFTGDYFNNQTLSGTPALTRNDSTVNFDWGLGSPDPSLPADHFSVRWTKTQYFSAGTYKFTAIGDDGIRLKIDGTTILDKWFDQGATTYSVDKTLTDGNHVVIFEFYDNTQDAVAKLNWTLSSPPPPPPPSSGFNGEYFSNQNLSGTPALTRTDKDINFDWGLGKADPALPEDHFSVRWTGNSTFTAGTYQFNMTCDDGCRLKIDGTTVIDQWKDQSATTYNISQALTSGPHSIVMEYYENMWDAVAKLNWSPTP